MTGEATAGDEVQRTLAGSVSLEGTGLHSGESVEAELRPGDPDTGLRFRRVDLEGAPSVRATVENVSGVEWETVLGDGEGSIRTVEHLLAALTAARLDNVEILVRGPEPPAMDGSSAPWCEAIERAGVVDQDRPARVLEVTEPIEVVEGESRYTVLPYPGYRVSAEIEYDHPTIGRQYASARVEQDEFCAEVAAARTFGLKSWKEPLREQGLALGSSYENTIVLTDDGLDPESELRCPDEFVRHKLIDLVGDLTLVGGRLRAHVVAEKPGHRGNVALARRLEEELASGGGGEGSDGGPALDIHEILEYMPHRYPFLMVDRVVEFEAGERIVGLKNVTINEPFFTGHFPEHPIMPGVLVVEAMAQAGGLLLMNEFDDPDSKVVYLMSLDDVKFRRPVIPGDTLLFELEMLQMRGRICKMRGTGRVDGEVVTEAKLLAQVVDK